MTQASGEKVWWGLAAVLALGLALLSGVARAESSPAAWVFDLLARVEQWQSTGPLDFLRNPDSLPSPLEGEGLGVRGVQAHYGRLPMHFEPNLGQTADEVKFVARGPGYTLFLTADEAVLALRPSRPASDRIDPRHRRRPFDLAAMAHDDTPAIPGAVIRTRLEGATRNPEPQPEGLEKLPGISNYFLGNDPEKWRTNVPHYQRVRYPNVYPGIDLVYYGNPQRLEHDFIVAPGADPAAIQLAISGAEQATVNAEGDLVLKVPGGEVVQQAPRIYQVIDGQPQAVAGHYMLRDAAPGALPTVNVAAAEPEPQPLLVGFEVAQYDRNQPLVIDPVLVYSTYLGGSNGAWGGGIAVDGAGNAYVTGETWSADFPTRNAPYPQLWGTSDAFIAKLSASGTALVYATYLGGSSSDSGDGIAVDGAGNAYVTGETWSADFPTRNAPYPNFGGGYYDAFIVKLSASGTALVYSTYLGGSSSDSGNGIAVDGAGNAYVTGGTNSADFPTHNAPYPQLWGTRDAFIAKLSASGTALVYSTYLGGSSSDWGNGIAVDGAGNAYVTGRTNSADFPTHNALYPNFGGDGDAFIAKIADSIYPIYPDICSIVPQSGVKNRLVLVVHGWNSNSEDWPTLMADMIGDQIQDEPGVKWHICAYDWRVLAGDGCWPLPAGCFSPWVAYENALLIGQTLGNQLATLDLDHIHFIGHSAGSQVVETAASWVWIRTQQSGKQRPTIHSTFLDAFDPRQESSTYGQYADFADQYFDIRRTGITTDLDGTDLVLPYAYNVDVTELDPSHSPNFVGIHAHQWPYEWYRKTISMPSAENYGLSHGFVFALESGKISLPSHSLFGLARGGVTRLYPPVPTQATLLAGLTSAGQIYYATNRTTWINIPGQLSQLQVGDLNGDGWADLVGLTSAGQIYYTTNRSTWTRIPGALNQLQVGDLNGDGRANLAGLAGNGSIWYTTNLSTWVSIPGQLSQIRVGDLNGDGRADLAGLAGNGSIWYTTNRATWVNIPGGLSQLQVGDLNGDGRADLAGLAGNGSIWYTTNRATWTNIPGGLGRIVVGDLNGDGHADLAGLAGNGTIWYTTNFSTWSQIPGGLNRLVVGDFNNDGRDDLAGLAGDGTIWYTTDLHTWTNIPGQLNRLAGDD